MLCRRQSSGREIDGLICNRFLRFLIAEPACSGAGRQQQQAEEGDQSRRALRLGEPVGLVHRIRAAEQAPHDGNRHDQREDHTEQRQLYGKGSKRIELPFGNQPIESRIGVPAVTRVGGSGREAYPNDSLQNTFHSPVSQSATPRLPVPEIALLKEYRLQVWLAPQLVGGVAYNGVRPYGRNARA